MTEEYCICGHHESLHKKEVSGIPCWECGTAGTWECVGFKLDNLRYIEDLAKERNLIN